MGRNTIVPLCQPIIPLNCMQFQSLHPEQKRPRGIIRGLEHFLREEKPNRILQLGKYTSKERDGRNTYIMNKLGRFSNNRNQLGLQISDHLLGLKHKDDILCILIKLWNSLLWKFQKKTSLTDSKRSNKIHGEQVNGIYQIQ